MAELDAENEVLEFDDDSLPELPDDNPFEDTGTKRPWLLVGIGVVAITLVVVVVLKLTMGGRDSETGLIEIPIESAALEDVPSPDFVDQANKLVAVDNEKPTGMPERVVDNRKSVSFDPDKPTVRRPKPRPIVGKSSKPARDSSPAKTAQISGGRWMVQVGSYPTRAAAESGQRKLQAAHDSLFGGHNFTILAAVLPNGQTTYRLRVVGFETGHEANGFCRNAQSDGVQCYVAK
ncbi:MAG: SPOR domain-containing protein [Rickettsiales bacterium]|jgi:cell division septation protein DedD|nr:SPOR domain-containing protein [Rickettsiales bacterium]